MFETMIRTPPENDLKPWKKSRPRVEVDVEEEEEQVVEEYSSEEKAQVEPEEIPKDEPVNYCQQISARGTIRPM